MALNVSDGPYVHSNIYNFHSSMASNFLNSIDNGKGQRALEAQIAEIERVRNKLKEATDSFLMGKTPQQASTELLNRENTYSGIGLEILRTSKMRDSLMADNMLDVSSLQEKIPTVIFDQIDLDIMSLDTATEIVYRSLPKGFMGKEATMASQIKTLEDIFSPSMEQEIRSEIKGKLRSENGKIRKVIGDLIQKSGAKKIDSSSRVTSLAYFKQEFLRRTKDLKVSYEGQTPEDYLEEVERQLVNFLNVSNKGNASGILGEQWMKAVTVADSQKGLIVDIELTGNLNEGEGALAQMEKLVSHHQLKTQSQTDFIIVNQNGQKARVQAKNYMEINDALFDENESIIPNYRLQSERKFLTLMNALVETGTGLADEDVQAMSYLLANELWFSTHNSGPGGKRKLTGEKTGVSGVVARVDQFISKAMVNFLGITIDQSFDVRANASNLFYSFNNRLLVPTYMILDGIIENLKDVKNQLASLHLTVKRSGLDWAFHSAEGFYAAKREAVGQLDPARNYSDSELVEVGVSQGNKVINSLQVSNVGLKIDIQTLLSSAYGF